MTIDYDAKKVSIQSDFDAKKAEILSLRQQAMDIHRQLDKAQEDLQQMSGMYSALDRLHKEETGSKEAVVVLDTNVAPPRPSQPVPLASD